MWAFLSNTNLFICLKWYLFLINKRLQLETSPCKSRSWTHFWQLPPKKKTCLVKKGDSSAVDATGIQHVGHWNIKMELCKMFLKYVQCLPLSYFSQQKKIKRSIVNSTIIPHFNFSEWVLKLCRDKYFPLRIRIRLFTWYRSESGS